MKVTLKRSVSPDGKIDALTIEAELGEDMGAEEALNWLEGVARKFKSQTPPANRVVVASTPVPAVAPVAGAPTTGGIQKLTGTLLAIHGRQPSNKPGGKPGPYKVDLSVGTFSTFDGGFIADLQKVPIGSEVSVNVQQTRFGWDLVKS